MNQTAQKAAKTLTKLHVVRYSTQVFNHPFPADRVISDIRNAIFQSRDRKRIRVHRPRDWKGRTPTERRIPTRRRGPHQRLNHRPHRLPMLLHRVGIAELPDLSTAAELPRQPSLHLNGAVAHRQFACSPPIVGRTAPLQAHAHQTILRNSKYICDLSRRQEPASAALAVAKLPTG